MASLSAAERLARLSPSERAAALALLSPAEAEALLYDWRGFLARPEQIMPEGDWDVWLCLAGRGFGKTRTGAEAVREEVGSGRSGRIGLIAETAADARDVMVAELLRIFPPGETPVYVKSNRCVEFSNGAKAWTYNATEPDQLRGPQHDFLWHDELCLVAGTLIEAERGQVPIECVSPGERVWTRKGLRRVKCAWQSSPSAEVWRAVSRQGREIIGTGSHPVWTDEFGFIPLREMQNGDTLAAWKSNASNGAPRLSGRTIPDTTPDAVAKVERLPNRAAVYNIEVEGDHEYFANGILTHNCKWRYARETWDQAQFGLRLGRHPRQIVTTTPRPIELVKAIMAGQEGRVHITRGSTLDNRSNLAASFLDRVVKRYAGTRLGRQELNAEVLGDLPGALWTLSAIDSARVPSCSPDQLKRVVVGVDPAVTNTEESDWHGIVVAGSLDQTGYVLEDASCTGSPNKWARRALAAYDQWQADAIVVEVNQGGDMVANTIRAIRQNVKIIEVRASRGKHVRAEPIAALYEQGRVRHVGSFPELETQMTMMTPAGYEGENSPDRVDALVWALSELFPSITRRPASGPVAPPKFSIV